MNDTGDDFSWVLELVRSAREHGYKRWTSGAESFGARADSFAYPAKWFHTIYPPLKPEHLDHIGIDFGIRFRNPDLLALLTTAGPEKLSARLRDDMKIKLSWPHIHKSFEAFLRCSNGCELFANKISLSGIDFPAMVATDLQPGSLATYNLFELQAGRGVNEIVIGAYQSDGLKLFQNIDTGGVVSRRSGSPTIVQTWGSLQEMLRMECERLNSTVPKNFL
jgi:hypothetical protein